MSCLKYEQYIEGNQYFFSCQSDAIRAKNLSLDKDRDKWSDICNLLYHNNIPFELK